MTIHAIRKLFRTAPLGAVFFFQKKSHVRFVLTGKIKACIEASAKVYSRLTFSIAQVVKLVDTYA